MNVTEVIIQNIDVKSSLELNEISNYTIGFHYVIEPSGEVKKVNDNTKNTSSIIDIGIIGESISVNQKKALNTLIAKLRGEIHALEKISIVVEGQLMAYQSN